MPRGLGEHSRLAVSLLDEAFRPVPGFSGADAAIVAKNGFREPVIWKGGPGLLPANGTVRLDISFQGVRPEDAQLHAAYVAS